ncbi:hypothetical protein [Nitratireductor sp. XY-223]|nr:hypothetical protein [Nitratireductor sp. XY-223]
MLVVARVSHAAYMLGYAGKPARLLGAGLTFLLMTVFGIYLIGRGSGLMA